MEDIFFAEPGLLWLLPLILVAGAISIRRCKNKVLVLSRAVVFALLVVALANPYVVVTQTTQTKRPLITVISDETDSMDIFDPGTAQRVYDQLPNSQLRTFSGTSTPLGDKILQYAQQGSTQVLVSDGYNNKGRDLEEALILARSANTTVFAIEIEPIAKDASVEIDGTYTAVLGGDYPFNVILRWAGGHFEGTLTVRADDRIIYQDHLSEEGKSRSIRMSHTFLTTGPHLLRATIYPQEDRERVNNQYQKAVYVVPKPDVLLVTTGSSPLASVLSKQYKVTEASDYYPDKKYKAVVLDDQKYRSDHDALDEYVSEGGGLVVVGGSNSYDFGNYLNSSLEKILPVRSAPSIFEGGNVVILVLDISGSTRREMAVGGTTFLEYEKSLAIELLKSPQFQDDQIGVVIFGTEARVISSPAPLFRIGTMIKDRIRHLDPMPGSQEETQLDAGLNLAWDMLNSTGTEGEVVVISDGRVKEYPETYQRSIGMINNMGANVYLIEVKSFEDAPGGFVDLAEKTGSAYYSAVYPGSVTIKTGEPTEAEAVVEEEAPVSAYNLMIFNPRHYITSDLDLKANVTGFNDVTPRSGSQRLVVMASGKPILTTWRYGLGRVASLATDDGTMWSPELYSAQNSILISRTVNWAVGDPRPESGRIDAADGWVGTPMEISIISESPPSIGSGQDLDLEKVGDDRYRATLTPEKKGVYRIGDYAIAVNYPIEFRDIGSNPEFSRLIMANGGRIFSEAKVRGELVEEARKRGTVITQQRVSKRGALLFTALAIFLVEVLIRRRREIKGRRGG